jgi:ABC-type multidrug transport system fused ATPase/permease subunit
MARSRQRRCPTGTSSHEARASGGLYVVKPNLPLRQRVPKAFLVVVALLALWATLIALPYLSPSLVNTLFFAGQNFAGWVFLAVFAIVGAVLVGMFLSHRLLSHGGFTPFEEEMLRMRKDVQQSLTHAEKMREEVSLLRVEVARLKRATRSSSGSEEGPHEGLSTRSTPAKGAEALASAGEGSEGLEQFGR